MRDREAQPEQAPSVVAALRELVELKDLKESLPDLAAKASATPWLKAREDYYRRKPLAWEAARAALASTPPVQAEQPPHPGSPEASAMIDSVLAEYNWPANTKNAARAGYVAALRFLATPPSAAEGIEQPKPVHDDPALPSLEVSPINHASTNAASGEDA